MKRFSDVTQIPVDCVVAPTAYRMPRPGAKPVGKLGDLIFYRSHDVSELRSEVEWRKLGRQVRPEETPLAERGAPEPLAVYADWQTS